MRDPGKKLIVSFHDLHPGSWECCRRFMERCRSYGANTLSLLLVPQFHGQPPFTENQAFVSWLRRVSEGGYEICLHGYYHKAENISGGHKERLVANYYTNREGEFYQLSAKKAKQRVSGGLHLLKQSHLPVYGFTAPAWLISDAARQVLIESGFLYQSLWSKVELLQSEASIPAPALVYGSRSTCHRMLSRAWIPFFHRWNRKTRILRLAVHPNDFRYPAIEHRLYALLQKALQTRTASTYRDLIPEASRRPVGTAPDHARQGRLQHG